MRGAIVRKGAVDDIDFVGTGYVDCTTHWIGNSLGDVVHKQAIANLQVPGAVGRYRATLAGESVLESQVAERKSAALMVEDLDTAAAADLNAADVQTDDRQTGVGNYQRRLK